MISPFSSARSPPQIGRTPRARGFREGLGSGTIQPPGGSEYRFMTTSDVPAAQDGPSLLPARDEELAWLLARVAQGDQIAFEAVPSRMRMHTVPAAQLRAMNAQRERCVLELGDAGVEAVLYACLVAQMVGAPGEHQRVEASDRGDRAADDARTKIAERYLRFVAHWTA